MCIFIRLVSHLHMTNYMACQYDVRGRVGRVWVYDYMCVCSVLWRVAFIRERALLWHASSPQFLHYK